MSGEPEDEVIHVVHKTEEKSIDVIDVEQQDLVNDGDEMMESTDEIVKQKPKEERLEEEGDDDATSNKNSKKGKRKKKSGNKGNSKPEDAEVDGEEPKKAKKPRVKPEKAQEVYEKLIDEMVDNYKIGMTEVPLDTIASKIGYKNVRSDAILAAKKLMKVEGLAEVLKGNTCKLTDAGVKKLVPTETPAANPEEAMKRFWNHLDMKLSSHKHTSSAQARTSAKKMFDLLKDGKAHSKQELREVTHYNMDRSTGFPEIIKAMKDLGFVEKGGSGYKFTQKMFPFGKP